MRIEGLCKKYGETVVLDGFTADIKEGAVTALMGRSGIGKTTLLRILLGLEVADEGCVSDLSRPAVAVFQEDRLSEPLSAVQNARLGRRDATKEEAKEVLTALGLSEDANRPVSTLSGGMRRRVAIARALLSDAPTLLLDEPFTGLDDKTKKEIIPYIKRALMGRTVLLITHDENEAALLADERLYL